MIVGLFPGLASVGGVQAAGCQTAAALTSIANERGCSCAVLSLNDENGEHASAVGNFPFQFRGFARNKPRFIFAALRLALARPDVIFAAHPNLAPIAAAIKLLNPNAQLIIGAHGIEIWQRLPVLRRAALCRADIVIAPSSDTARKLAEIQDVRAEKSAACHGRSILISWTWPILPAISRSLLDFRAVKLSSQSAAGLRTSATRALIC